MADFRIERDDVFHMREILRIDDDVSGGKREIRFRPNVLMETLVDESCFVMGVRPNIVRFPRPRVFRL